jgi:hypothetical protein
MHGETKAIERLLDIQARPDCDQAGRTQRDKLSPRSYRQGIVSVAIWNDVKEALIHVEFVFIYTRARATISSVDKATIELNEGSESRAKMQVGTR